MKNWEIVSAALSMKAPRTKQKTMSIEEPTATKKVIALEKDLFFAVKIRDTLRHHQMNAITLRNVAAFAEQINNEETRPDIAIVNTATVGIDWEEAIRIARSHGLPVLAFGSHMDLDARNRALQAGANKVVANSKFARSMPDLIQHLLSQPANTVSGIDEEE